MAVPQAPAPNLVRYIDIRDRIQDGDLFLWRGQFKSSELFEDLTNAFYSHAAIAAKWHDRLMVLQAEAHVEAVPLSYAIATYPGRVDWYRLRRERIDGHEQIVARTLAEAKSDLGLPFGAIDLIRSLWGRLTRTILPNARVAKAMFCSEYVHRCFRAGGLDLTGKSDIDTMPQDIANCGYIEYLATVEHNPKHAGDRATDDVPTA